MLRRRNEPAGRGDIETMRRAYEDHLAQVTRFIAKRSCFSTLMLDYADVVTRPRDAAARMAHFLGGRLDMDRMAAVADPALYRNRRKAAQ
jgi:hypothetical protein